MTIPASLAAVYSTAPSGVYYMEALTIGHDELSKVIHITNASVGFSGSTENVPDAKFIAVPFTLKLPDKDTSGSQKLEIVISNVEQEFIEQVELMAKKPYAPATVRYRVYLSTQDDGAGNLVQQINPSWRYDISSFTVNQDSIIATASKTNAHNRAYPGVRYTSGYFPGLDK